MPKFNHRIAFEADIFLTIETDSPDTTMEQLEALAVAELRRRCEDFVPEDCEVADLGFNVDGLDGVDGRIYPRTEDVVTSKDHLTPSVTTKRLSNLTLEDCSEVPDNG